MKQVILTGDRPTGPLHLGHYVGSLANRVALQEEYDTFIIIADYQVLTDKLADAKKVAANIREVLLDYLAVGIDPSKSTIFIQSAVPQLSELTMYFSMMVNMARLRRNPTVKSEALKLMGITEENQEEGKEIEVNLDPMSYGFVGYPISQAADILLFRGNLIPVGKDQEPHIEQTAEIAKKFNRQFGRVFPIPKALVGEMPRLPDILGKNKMGKSAGNAINLSASFDDIRKMVMKMYTDPSRVRATDPGKVEGNVVFVYLDAFHPNKSEVEGLKKQYQEGKIGDVALKNLLFEVLRELLEPIQSRRLEFSQDDDFLAKVLTEGTEKAISIGEKTIKDVRDALGFSYSQFLKFRW